MVYFQCETCCETLKKKQVENHYLHQCRNATHFMCLSCQGLFDRNTIKAHTSCISEDEKYKKGDNLVYDSEKKVLQMDGGDGCATM